LKRGRGNERFIFLDLYCWFGCFICGIVEGKSCKVKRPKISEMVIGVISTLVDSQDVKGYEKYAKTIDEAKDNMWDWNQMALEETVDGMKYLMKENVRLREIVTILKNNNAELTKIILDLRGRM
jgi:hypothetical protein